jgi:hypothetical protein
MGMYSIEHYVIKFVSDLKKVGGFLMKVESCKSLRRDIVKISIVQYKLDLVLISFLFHLCVLVIWIIKHHNPNPNPDS